ALDPTYGFTVEAWVYPTLAPHSWATVVSKTDSTPFSQYELHLVKASGAQAVLCGVIGTSDGSKLLQGTNPIPINAWTHVAMTYDLTNLCLYVNGRLDTRQTKLAQMRTTQAPLYIGGGLFYLFDGRIDELSIYGRALTPWELQWICDAGSSGKCSTPSPPVIQMQPTNQTVLAGATVWLGGLVSGTEPFFYQWYFNGNGIPGARSETLVLTNIQPFQAGSYSFAVSNLYGAITSRAAEVVVLSSPSIVQAVGGAFDSGGIVKVPVELVASGAENALAFTLNFSPGTLSYLDVQPGKNADSAALMVNTNEVSTGSLGIGLAMPVGRAFAPGTQQVASVTFLAPTVETQSMTFMTLGDSLAKRQVVDTNATVLPASFIGGTIVMLPAGFEGDVMPRPYGESEVTVADWAQVGRYVARLDYPTNFGEFRRADCAPRSTLGDGTLGLADWVQTGRYAIGLDPITPAGGPGLPTLSPVMPVPRQAPGAAPKGVSRRISASRVTAAPNASTCVSVSLQSHGDESAVAFSLSFDPSALTYEGAAPGEQIAQAQFNINASEAAAGRLAVVLG
ncbi:MAG TPA: LamG-like jellyroll fold domain-containing protein, partial [Verrucomicrobiae bacterium]|nr:LamG-like jellyroll fold domain-containing protein [Verrucomicrobiae bacterium]